MPQTMPAGPSDVNKRTRGFARDDRQPAHAGWSLDPEHITCPVRIVWGTADRLRPWPAAAVRFRTDWLPHADWIELEGVGHSPQLDVPLETAQLILGFTA
jgi:pimeloyl-ACP methyl ester carboxylesterase